VGIKGRDIEQVEEEWTSHVTHEGDKRGCTLLVGLSCFPHGMMKVEISCNEGHVRRVRKGK
jgi:hypothetical protein